jgi:hypothetical protein
VIVYLETNFLFELATGRDTNDSCVSLLQWCREEQIALRIPAHALLETRTALRRRAAIQTGVARDLQDQHRDVDRARTRDLADLYLTAAQHLKNSADVERQYLMSLSEELLHLATILPTDREVLLHSERFRIAKVLTGDGDLLNFASIIRDLDLRKSGGDVAQSMFITGDADFANVRQWLQPYSCDLLTSYSAAVARLKGQLA